MSVEVIKLELIVWIGQLKDTAILKKLAGLKEILSPVRKSERKPGWGKKTFSFVAPDFDEKPEGFEDYMPV